MRASTSAASSPSRPRPAERIAAQQRIGQLERVAPGDVEAVEEPVPDEVEVRGQSRAPTSPSSPRSCVEHLAGVVVGLEELARRRVGR